MFEVIEEPFREFAETRVQAGIVQRNLAGFSHFFWLLCTAHDSSPVSKLLSFLASTSLQLRNCSGDAFFVSGSLDLFTFGFMNVAHGFSIDIKGNR